MNNNNRQEREEDDYANGLKKYSTTIMTRHFRIHKKPLCFRFYFTRFYLNLFLKGNLNKT